MSNMSQKRAPNLPLQYLEWQKAHGERTTGMCVNCLLRLSLQEWITQRQSGIALQKKYPRRFAESPGRFARGRAQKLCSCGKPITRREGHVFGELDNARPRSGFSEAGWNLDTGRRNI